MPSHLTAAEICKETGMSRDSFYRHLNAEGDPYGLKAAEVIIPGMGRRYKNSRLHVYKAVCKPRPRKPAQ